MLALLFGGAILFYQLSQMQMKTLIVVMIMFVYVAAVMYYIYSQTKSQKDMDADKSMQLTTSINPNMSANSDLYPVKIFPKDGKFKYLIKNTTLMEIAEDIRFVKTFDKARYADLLLHMDKFQKTYIYILSDRYTCDSGIPMLLDFRSVIGEILYSMYLIVPKTLKHAYGLDPFKVLETNIDKFTSLSRLMMDIVEGHCKTQIPHTQPIDIQRMQPHSLP